MKKKFYFSGPQHSKTENFWITKYHQLVSYWKNCVIASTLATAFFWFYRKTLLISLIKSSGVQISCLLSAVMHPCVDPLIFTDLRLGSWIFGEMKFGAGNSTSSRWCVTASSAARCWTRTVRRLMMNSMWNFMFSTQRSTNLWTRIQSKIVFLRTNTGSKCAICGKLCLCVLEYYSELKPNFTLSSSTLCT